MRPIDEDALLKVRFIAPNDIDCGIMDVPYSVIDAAPTIDPIRAAGGCRCGECKNYVDVYGTGKMMCMRPIQAEDYSETGYVFPLEIETKETDFCSYGEPREAQDDG